MVYDLQILILTIWIEEKKNLRISIKKELKKKFSKQERSIMLIIVVLEGLMLERTLIFLFPRMQMPFLQLINEVVFSQDISYDALM